MFKYHVIERVIFSFVFIFTSIAILFVFNLNRHSVFSSFRNISLSLYSSWNVWMCSFNTSSLMQILWQIPQFLQIISMKIRKCLSSLEYVSFFLFAFLVNFRQFQYNMTAQWISARWFEIAFHIQDSRKIVHASYDNVRPDSQVLLALPKGTWLCTASCG